MNACQQASVQAVVLAVQPARQVVQLALSQAFVGTGMATRTPRSPMEATRRFARVLRAHVQSIAPPIVVAVLRGGMLAVALRSVDASAAPSAATSTRRSRR